jgi:outer membrane protein insertion porin family
LLFICEANLLGYAVPAEAAVKAAKSNSNQTKSMTGSAAKKKLNGVKETATPHESDVALSKKVTKITLKGNHKIENDAITARLVSKIGEPYSPEHIRQDVEAIFKSGYFYDVRVERIDAPDGSIELVYALVEKPSVVEVDFSGNSELETDELRESAGLKAFEILNMSKIRTATDKMQKLYEDKGFFLARITPKIETVVEGESVKLTFQVQENEKVRVKRITILGNHNIPDGKLKGAMQTQEGGFFSFISGSGAYKQDTFDRDMKLIEYLYINEGYIQSRIDRPQVYVTPDKKGVYITIRVDEGDRFKVGNVDFAGDLLFDRDDLFESVEIDGSGWYAHETLLKDMRGLQAKYGDLGYAYANIIPRTLIREREKVVDITFEIDKGNKVHFGRINVVGNSKTWDKVLRRELTIHEGELYNETRKRESLDNIKRLGYFDDVSFNASTPPDDPDVMNLDIVIKERNTGQIQVGAGYSTYSHFIFNGQVNEINLFGSGRKAGLSIDFSKNQSLFNLNFTEPYFLDTDWSLGFDLYQSKRILQEYQETKKGGAVRIGHPLAPYLRGFVRYKLEEIEIKLDPIYGDPDLFPVPTPADPNPKGNPNGLASSLTFTLEYDKRNDRFAPSKGIYSSISLEYAGLGGDKRYTQGFFNTRFYQKLFWEVVFRNSLTYGFVRSNDPNQDPPYNELFKLGGANSLRGFDWYSIGRQKYSQKRYACLTTDPLPAGCPLRSGPALPGDAAQGKAYLPFGGTQEAIYQAEFEFPLISEAGIKGVLFYDIGQAENVLELNGFRSDVGFGFRWFSPIGPLRFEWGFPLARQTEERAVNFQFAIGAPF